MTSQANGTLAEDKMNDHAEQSEEPQAPHRRAPPRNKEPEEPVEVRVGGFRFDLKIIAVIVAAVLGIGGGGTAAIRPWATQEQFTTLQEQLTALQADLTEEKTAREKADKSQARQTREIARAVKARVIDEEDEE